MIQFKEPKMQRMALEIFELLVTHYGGELSEEALDEGIASVHQALERAYRSHEGQFRKSGEAYFHHPLRVAHLASRYWMDFSSIIAAIMHDVVEDTPVTLEDVRVEFGEEVAILVDGLTKVTDDNLSRAALKEKTYRKQLLLAIKDVRVLCLKFWDRIDNLRTIGALPQQKQSLIAEETRSVYVPLARHLGMGYVASEMEALSVGILYPRRESSYRKNLVQVQQQCEGFLRKVKGDLQRSLESNKIPALLRDRWRPFSIAGAKNMGRGLQAVYTLEILVDRTMDAFQTLGVVHGLYNPIPGKLRDHLNVPSPFGYQSLKTTVQSGENRMRIEITTRKLARYNEAGVLAPGFEFQRANFHELMKSLLEGESALDPESLKIASASIQVYTPQGERRTLPEGSSALDFAFEIHEKVGLHARRARINGQTRLLKARLMDGDQVTIERDEFPQALPKWLEWAVTPKARNSIRRYLRQKVKKVDAATA